MQVADLPQRLAESAIWIRPFLAASFFPLVPGAELAWFPDAQAFRSEGNIGSPTDRASNGIDPREHPEYIDVCAKDPSSGQFCGVKALFPILGAAFVAGELAGRPCSTINLSTLKFSTRDRFQINRRALPAMAGRAVRR